jgi:hypothetical protein
MYTSLCFLHKCCVELCKVGVINSSIFLVNFSENISSPPISVRKNVCWSPPTFVLTLSFVKVRCMILDNTRSVKCKVLCAIILPECSFTLLTHEILSVQRPAPNWGNSTTSSYTKHSNTSCCQFLFDNRQHLNLEPLLDSLQWLRMQY